MLSANCRDGAWPFCGGDKEVKKRKESGERGTNLHKLSQAVDEELSRGIMWRGRVQDEMRDDCLTEKNRKILKFEKLYCDEKGTQKREKAYTNFGSGI